MGFFKKNAEDGTEITLKLDSSFYDDAKDVAKTAAGTGLGFIIAALVLRIFGGK